MAIFQRQKNPPAYTDYRRYKQLLRTDFLNRCAYCLLHEGDAHGGGYENFHIDHFRPKSNPLFAHLISDYTNLYYSCRWCNGAKSETWPSALEQLQGYGFIDPCQEDLYRSHSRLEETSGTLVSMTRPGDYTIREIRLNRKVFRDLRLQRIGVQARIDQTRRYIARLQTETPPKQEIIGDLEGKITLLIEKYINPKIPYEPEDLLTTT